MARVPGLAVADDPIRVELDMLQNEPLSGRRVLVVEDELLIAHDLAQSIAGRGAEIIGPVGTVADALELIASSGRLDGAVLDLNLGGEMAFPVAEALDARQVPFVFATGYGPDMLPPRFAGFACCEKPVELGCLVRALLRAPDAARPDYCGKPTILSAASSGGCG
jgi:CheY-like chemotaxis protein